jgi:hypothetical protein
MLHGKTYQDGRSRVGADHSRAVPHKYDLNSFDTYCCSLTGWHEEGCKVDTGYEALENPRDLGRWKAEWAEYA